MIAEALEAQARLATLKDVLWVVDRLGGVVFPDKGYQPFPFPKGEGVGLIRTHEPPDKRSLEPVLNSWRSALKCDADAPLPR